MTAKAIGCFIIFQMAICLSMTSAWPIGLNDLGWQICNALCKPKYWDNDGHDPFIRTLLNVWISIITLFHDPLG